MKAMKIEEQVLSREQMAHLEELGVDTSDASMILVVNKENPSIVSIDINDPLPYVGNCACDFIPTYTIGDLIEKLPRYIYGHELFIELGCKCGYRRTSDKMYVFAFNNHLEGLYKLICWVAENYKELIK